MARVVLSNHWKSRSVILSLAMLGTITSLLTDITVLAQTSSDGSGISQSSADNAVRKPNDVRSTTEDGTSVTAPANTVVKDTMNTGQFGNQSGTVHIEKTTSSYRNTKPPVVCRSRAIRTVLEWKCPRLR